jgi:hypothetical protein
MLSGSQPSDPLTSRSLERKQEEEKSQEIDAIWSELDINEKHFSGYKTNTRETASDKSKKWAIGDSYEQWVNSFFERYQEKIKDFRQSAVNFQKLRCVGPVLSLTEKNNAALKDYTQRVDVIRKQIIAERPQWRLRFAWPLITLGWPFHKKARAFAEALLKKLKSNIQSAKHLHAEVVQFIRKNETPSSYAKVVRYIQVPPNGPHVVEAYKMIETSPVIKGPEDYKEYDIAIVDTSYIRVVCSSPEVCERRTELLAWLNEIDDALKAFESNHYSQRLVLFSTAQQAKERLTSQLVKLEDFRKTLDSRISAVGSSKEDAAYLVSSENSAIAALFSRRIAKLKQTSSAIESKFSCELFFARAFPLFNTDKYLPGKVQYAFVFAGSRDFYGDGFFYLDRHKGIFTKIDPINGFAKLSEEFKFTENMSHVLKTGQHIVKKMSYSEIERITSGTSFMPWWIKINSDNKAQIELAITILDLLQSNKEERVSLEQYFNQLCNKMFPEPKVATRINYTP